MLDGDWYSDSGQTRLWKLANEISNFEEHALHKFNGINVRSVERNTLKR